MAETDPLYTLPSVPELAEIAEQELRLALDPSGTGVVDLHDGSRNTALVSMMVYLAHRAVRYASDREAAARASTAELDDLDTVGRDFYGEPRKEPAKAAGYRLLQRPGGRPATVIPAGSRFAMPATPTSPAVVFEAARTVNVLLSETTALVPIVAVAEGEAGNLNGLGPNAITQIVDSLPDTAWTLPSMVANLELGGGAEEESDAIYRARLLTLGSEDQVEKGTQRAVLGGVLRVSGVRYATVVEPFTGNIVAFVGDAGYVLTDVMRAAIQAELLNWRCFGVPLDLRPLHPVDLVIDATVYMSRALSNYDTDAIRTAAERMVGIYLDGRPHVDEYFREMIAGCIGQAHAEVQHVVLSSPVSDVARPADGTYASALDITHYRLAPGTLRLRFLPPLTS